MEYDFLIVGQGLAGTILAFELLDKNYSVKIIDHNHQGSSSMAAAGIINPFTGPRLNVSKDFLEKYLQAKKFYHSLEQTLNQNFFHSIEQKRWIHSENQRNYYLKRLKDFPDFFKHQNNKTIIDINFTYVLKVANFLKSSQNYFLENADLDRTYFKYDLLNIKPDYLKYKNINIKRVIFCEGYQNIHNPFFKYNFFQLSKGSVFELCIKNLERKLYNWGQWLSPSMKGENSFFLGASYHWDLNKSLTIDKEYSNLCAHLPNFFNKNDFKILEHKTGIRPTTKKRKVAIETSIQDSRISMFNGFGSKGCLEIPLHAKKYAASFDLSNKIKN